MQKKRITIRSVVALVIITVILLVGGMMLFKKEWIVGKDIQKKDINEFYYTIASSGNPPYFQRYYFGTENGRYYFAHEKREGDHWPLTENDVTIKGKVELSEAQWDAFYHCLQDGKVTKRNDDTKTGYAGPFLYLYWQNDRGKVQEFHFVSAGRQKEFETLCLSLFGQEADADGMHRVTVNGNKPFDGPECYRAGETVRLSFLLMTDCSVHISSFDVDGKEEYDADTLNYVFTMPDHDVEIRYEVVNDMVSSNSDR